MAIDRATFAEECVRQGVFFRVEPHYLLAVAQLRSGISEGDDGDRKGPFRLTQAEWDANRNNDEFDVHFTTAQISSALRQCAVFGLMAHRSFDAFMSAKGRNPSALELYLQQWPAADGATLSADFQKAVDATADLLGPAADAVLDDPQSAPPAIAKPEQSTTRPVPAIETGGAPEWYRLASNEIGTREQGNNSGPAILRYRQLAKCGQDHDPWCAIFANAMFASCTPPVTGTRSASSQSFRSNNSFVKLTGPALGAVVVFWRVSPASGLGHVGFYRGETAESIYVLGGNEDNMVQIAPMSKKQLIGYWWPASANLPAIAKIAVPPGTPRQTRVT
ncbi:MAG TPA: TIGR02594 family protein [Xanthobacteraceae bacterium]|nr:TIGR02594 family protein [Xanthobacteraceae bacterium]